MKGYKKVVLTLKPFAGNSKEVMVTNVVKLLEVTITSQSYRSIPIGVFTCSILESIVTILVSIVVVLTGIEPILEKCGHLQVLYL